MDRRRGLLRGVLLVALVVGLGGAAHPVFAQAPKREKVVVAYLPLTVAMSATNEYLRKHKSFEKVARQLGYEVEVEWKQFPSGPATYEALGPGHVHIGAVGAAPTAVAITRNSPVYVISMSEGHLEFALLVHNDSPIRSLDDLVKKRAAIGLPVGSDAHRFLANMWQHTYGKSPQETGLTLTNMTPADIYLVPRGMDAFVVWNPGPVLVEDVRKRGKRLINSYGLTGSAHEEGAGKLFPSVKKHWAFPEGYMLHRTIQVAHRAFADKHPDLVTAWLVAQQEAVRALAKDTRMAHEVANVNWKMDYEHAKKMLDEDTIIGYRDWIWETEGDLAAIVYGSEFLHSQKVIPRVVTWEDITKYTAPILPAVKKAYEMSGGYPSLEAFTDKSAKDIRGVPMWMPERFDPQRWKAMGLGHPNPLQK